MTDAHEQLCRPPVSKIEVWAARHLRASDIVVLEARATALRWRTAYRAGHPALVPESAPSCARAHHDCGDDRFCAVKWACSHLTWLAKEVWQPGPATWEHREVFFAHRNAVKDVTQARNRIRPYLNGRCLRLPKGTALTDEKTPARVLVLREWGALQPVMLTELFVQPRQAEARRNELEILMVRELIARPEWARLWRLMGVRHRVAFALMVLIGEVRRFATAKKLCAYTGLSPRQTQSGNDARDHEKGID